MNYINNWLYQLTGSFAAGQSTLPLPAAALERLALAEGAEYLLTLSATLNPTTPGETEIIRLTGTAGGYTIARGQEGTHAQSWPEGTSIWCAVTAGGLETLPKVGDLLVTLRDPGPRYLPANGGPFDAEAYPELARILGSGQDGWASVDGPENELTGVATDGSGLWFISSWNGLYRSNDDGVTWALVDGLVGDRYCIATDGQGVWITSGYGGTYRSDDNGQSWDQVFGVAGYMTSLVAGADGAWIGFDSSANSTMISVDRGVSWAAHARPLVFVNGAATDGAGTWILTGNNDDDDTAVRSTDNGSTWSVIDIPGWRFGGAIGTDGSGTWIAYGEMVGGPSGHRRSVDNGETWTALALELGDTRSISADGATWVITGGGAAPYGVMSADGGNTWAEINEFDSLPVASSGKGETWIAVATGDKVYRMAGPTLPTYPAPLPLRAFILAA